MIKFDIFSSFVLLYILLYIYYYIYEIFYIGESNAEPHPELHKKIEFESNFKDIELEPCDIANMAAMKKR